MDVGIGGVTLVDYLTKPAMSLKKENKWPQFGRWFKIYAQDLN